MYKLSVYLFVVIFYPSIVNLWILKPYANTIFTRTSLLNLFLFLILTGLGLYYEVMDMIFWNIALIIMIAFLFAVCWAIRTFVVKTDFTMKDRNQAKSVVETELKNHYRKIKKILAVISILYTGTALVVGALHRLRIIQVHFSDLPLPYIWTGVILFSACFVYHFNIQIIEKWLVNRSETDAKESHRT